MSVIIPENEEFIELAKDYSVIPVYKQISADMFTPVSVFKRLNSEKKYSFLLESVESQKHIGRYSFVGIGAPVRVYLKDAHIVVDSENNFWGIESSNIDVKGNPLDIIKQLMNGWKSAIVPDLPRFSGGWVGFVGYEMSRFFDRIPVTNQDVIKFPEFLFMLVDTLVIFDHFNCTLKVVKNINVSADGDKQKLYNNAVKDIDDIIGSLLKDSISSKDLLPEFNAVEVGKSFSVSKVDYERMVNKAKNYIIEGDIIQVVLSQRIQMKCSSDPLNIYRLLRIKNPSPYMFYLNLDDYQIIGSSPEMLVRCEDRIVETCPIAGTRPRGNTIEEDELLKEDLLADPKEKAEHLMLVDLARNDLGRVCDVGTVKVTEFMKVEEYSHVMHIVSVVQGELKQDKDIFDLLKATFPAGTVSGAPKIRAMEIIDSLENTQRGPYAGCVGYIGFTGNLDTCITIRTIFKNNDNIYIQAGAGIVADSVPEREYQECINKALALVEVIQEAQNIK